MFSWALSRSMRAAVRSVRFVAWIPTCLATVHLTDAASRSGEVWSDEDRYTMPGDGIVPVKQIIHAVLDTGYDRVNTDETSPERYQSRDRARIAKGLKAKGDEVLASL